jgi:hypothetical protein
MTQLNLTGNTCSIKISKKTREFFNQGRGLCQGCNLSPAFFNIYVKELDTILDKSSAPGLILHNSEVKSLLFADDLCLLSPAAHGLQRSLDLLEQYCQTWALVVNPKNTEILIFQRRSRSQGIRPKFSIGTKYRVLHTLQLLRFKISSTGHLNEAVNELSEKGMCH